ncbi:transcription termination/antitermination factor NusG [Pseudoprevotella muciniphila]|uniref:Transcription termination/antitermination protein NusG n=1 Tax=Pseudoprevotella muciniphila TaxID=2133944 RepID=A0A5P8E8D6_9BACT|nr:transcription termination/antitermination protein NusG [Pseudoprevotella muciniphila]QFQ13208.1 transcription termination/antitermination factor NusG [Pseudoprevotella muciniphila]
MATEMQWYVLRAVSGKEAKVKEYIDAEIKNNRFDGLVSQVLIPTEKVVQQRGSKRVVKDRTLMSGYVFVEAKLVGEIAHELRQTPNVLGFLGGMDNPTPLPLREVNQLLGKMDEMQAENPEMEIPFTIGENVKVIDGPLSGFSGVIEKIDREKRKLIVVVTVFGRSTPLELGPMQVERK